MGEKINKIIKIIWLVISNVRLSFKASLHLDNAKNKPLVIPASADITQYLGKYFILRKLYILLNKI